MGTFRQKNLAREIINNVQREEPLNKTELLESVGYTENTAKHKAGEILAQEGVQEELEVLGFTEEEAKRVVVEIMRDPLKEPNARLKATDQVFKVRGSYAPEKKDITTQGEKLPHADLDALAELMAERLKETKI